MEPDADVRAPGAAVTVALCGHWDHPPPCPSAPHHVRADHVEAEVRIRVLFAAEPDDEQRVRHLIESGLAGGVALPDGLTPAWRLNGSRSSEVSAEEADHAERLIHS